MIEEKAAKKTEKRYNKIQRKVIFSLFSFIFIIILPYLDNRYYRFDSVYNTYIKDLIFLPNDMFSSVQILEEVSLFVAFMTIILVYMFIRYIWVSKVDFYEEKHQIRVKKTLEHFDIISFIFFIFTGYVVINAFFFSFAQVDGTSMMPTFSDQDDVILSHYSDEYERFDIVVIEVDDPYFETPQFYIKRLIGLPGETVKIEQGVVFINDVAIDEPYLAENTETTCYGNETTCSFTLETGEYFVMGDNRENSRDSRSVGPFRKDNLYGQVRLRIRPFSAFGKVE